MISNYPFGVVYFFEDDYPPAELVRDVANMADLGFDLITLWPAANSWLAKNPADFAFDATLRVLDLLHRRNMRAVIQLIGQNPSQEYLPDALLMPEMYVQPEEGRITGGGTWANPNHPAVDALAKAYLQTCVRALKNHPAVYAWDVYNEAHLRTDDPWTVSRYHTWLKEKYGTIEVLNRRWFRRFNQFEQINPRERRAGYSAWSSLLPSVDYERFRADTLTAICKRWVEYIKEVDTSHPVMLDGTSAQLLAEDITQRNNDEFGSAQVCDIYGGTFYPKSWGRNFTGKIWGLALHYELPAAAARKAGKPYVLNELQTHTQSALTPGSEVQPGELAAWIMMGIASGAQSFQLFRYRPFMHGYQASGRGLTDLDGMPNARAAAVKELVRVLRRHEPLFASARPAPPAVKILVSYRARLFHDAFFRWAKTDYPDCIRGWYRAFWELGIPTQISNLEDLAEDDWQTPVLVVPTAVSLARKEAEWLREYVRQGGCLIADARLGVVDEWGVCPAEKVPGEPLSQALGLVEEDVASESSFDLKGERVRAPFMTQLVRLFDNARALASLPGGEPAVVSHEFGKGRTLYFTSFMGFTLLQELPHAVLDLLRETVLGRAPQTPFAPKGADIHAAYHRAGAEHLIYLVNASPVPQSASLYNQPAAKAVDLVNGEEFSSLEEIQLGAWQYRVLNLRLNF